jgi:hypothetical protein
MRKDSSTPNSRLGFAHFANAASRCTLDKRNLDGDLDESDVPEHMRKISRLNRVPQVGNGVLALNANGPAR